MKLWLLAFPGCTSACARLLLTTETSDLALSSIPSNMGSFTIYIYVCNIY